MLEDAPRAQVNLSVDLHAGDEAKLPALALEVAAAQLDLCTIEINRAGFTFSS